MIKKKQINLFSYFFLPSVGGAQVCAHSMAIAYKELGYEVNLITSKDCFLFLKDKKLPYNVISIGNLPLTLIKNHNGVYSLVKDWGNKDKSTGKKGRKIRYIDLLNN